MCDRSIYYPVYVKPSKVSWHRISSGWNINGHHSLFIAFFLSFLVLWHLFCGLLRLAYKICYNTQQIYRYMWLLSFSFKSWNLPVTMNRILFIIGYWYTPITWFVKDHSTNIVLTIRQFLFVTEKKIRYLGGTYCKAKICIGCCGHDGSMHHKYALILKDVVYHFMVIAAKCAITIPDTQPPLSNSNPH